MNFKTFLSVTPTRIVKYARNIDYDFTDYTGKLQGEKLTSSSDTFGIVSQKGNAKIQKAIDWLICLSSDKRTFNPKFNSFFTWQVNFVTLSLPSKQMHTDKFLKKALLDKFLTYATRKWNIGNYLWRQEPQANGNIHYHICTDVFIPWQELRDVWINILKSYDYISNFEKLHHHKIPNCTDIHSLKNIKNIGAYLAKYCGKSSKGISIMLTKKNAKFPINSPYKFKGYYNSKTKKYENSYSFKGKQFYRQTYGRLWGCSQELSKVSKCKFMASDEQEKDLCRSASKGKIFTKYYDYCTIFNTRLVDMVDRGLKSIFDKVIDFILKCREPIPI